MNAELYILRNMNKSGMSNKEVSLIASALKSKEINIVYKTELDSDEDKIIESVAQSIKPEEHIDYVLIPNAYSLKAENTIVYKTLAFMTESGDNRVKVRLKEKLKHINGENISGKPVSGNGIKSGFYFVVGGTKFILLPSIERSELRETIKKAIDASNGIKIKESEIPKSAPLPDVKDINRASAPLKGKQGSFSKAESAVDTKPVEKPIEKPVEETTTAFINTEAPKVEAPKVDSANKIENKPKVENNDQSSGEISLKTYSHDVIKTPEVGSKRRKVKENAGNHNSQNLDYIVNFGGNSEKKKVNFFQGRFIPMKSDSGKEKLRKIILDLAIVVFVVAACIIVKVMVIDSAVNTMKYDELRKQVKVDNEIATEITTDAKGNKIVKQVKTSTNWNELKSINSEVIGWVNIDGTNIDYPVLQHKEDNDDYQFYLYKDIYKNYSGYGSVFADYRSNKGADSKNVILHGHHMNDGSMFQNLMGYGKYSAEMDFYKNHPTIDFDTPKGNATYKIISVFKTSTLDAHGDFFNYLTGSFASDAEFMNYVYLVRERSLIDTGVTCNEKDQLLTLSTCSYEYSEFRTVVVARKTRDGEGSKVDVSKASANPDPLWPDVYYGYDDSKKPNVTTFKTAYKAKEIDWYDGENATKLKGKERSFMLHENVELGEERPTSTATEAQTQPEQVTEAPKPTDAPDVKDQSILFNYSTLVMDVGDTETLEVYWTPDNTSNKALEWTSSNGNIAKIASGGKVTAKAPGECTITAKSASGNTTSCKIIVNDITATSITISPSNFITNKLGETFKITASVEPARHSHSVEWGSSNTNVATVSGGTVRVRGYGSCTISASIDGLTVYCNVTVNKPEEPQPEPQPEPQTQPPVPTQAPTPPPTEAPQPPTEVVPPEG